MTGGKRIIAFGPSGDTPPVAEQTAIELEASPEQWDEADPLLTEDAPAPLRSEWRAAALAAFAVSAWTGFYLWAERAVIAAGVTPRDGVTLMGGWIQPVLLIGLAWLLAMRTSRREAVRFVEEASDRVAATVTAQHLMYNRNAIFEGGLRPHRYCLPVLKHEQDRQALLDAVVRRGGAKFFLGTDSAPHARASKECGCGAAGCFTQHAALELYAAVFEAEGALHHLRAFACENGPRFYGLRANAERLPRSRVELRREAWTTPDSFAFGDGAVVVPVGAGEQLGMRAHVVDVAGGEGEAAAT